MDDHLTCAKMCYKPTVMYFFKFLAYAEYVVPILVVSM
jgi:hypothetical protein